MENSVLTFEGFDEIAKKMLAISLEDDSFHERIEGIMEKKMKDARDELVNAIGAKLKSDPREARRAVKRTVYKTILGGNLNIFNQKRGAAGARSGLKKPRKLDSDPHQRGGNRRPVNPNRNDLDTYFGKDRGMILRWLNSGVPTERTTRYGNRGVLQEHDFMGNYGNPIMKRTADAIVKLFEAEVDRVLKQQ